MINIEAENFNGFALYCQYKKPFGIISSNGEKKAICNTNTLPSKFKKYLVSIEDQRYFEHGAIDIKGISRALYENLKVGKVIQGGSTITQQLARNILKDNSKTLIRKIKEIKLAYELENQYSKDEILDQYFSKVFWGNKNYGIRTASLEYFSKEPENLNTSEQIALLTLLRGPNFYLRNETFFDNRLSLLSQTLNKRKILNSKKVAQIKKSAIRVQNNNLEVFRNSCVPYITERIFEKTHSIITTINDELQHEVTKYISYSKYPTSVICISEGKVIAVGSTNGSDYPFIFRSNVGSTLKPFIYSFLRGNGIDSKEVFKTKTSNNIDWEIREVQDSNKPFLTLKEALITSNNNTFVNASYEIGIEKTLSFLAKVTNKPFDNFVPSSILGATVDGFTLYELVQSYDRFFMSKEINPINQECLSILQEIAAEKFNKEFRNSYLKTGTTNLNKERFAIVGYANTLFGFLRQGNLINDYSKEGGFISSVLGFLRNISRKVYKWE